MKNAHGSVSQGQINAMSENGEAGVKVLCLGQDLIAETIGHLAIFSRFHCARGSSLGDPSEDGRIAEHLLKGDFSGDDPDIASKFRVKDLTTTAVQVAADGTKVIVGGDDRNLHDGLEQGDARLGTAFTEGQRSGLFKSNLAGVNIVEGTINKLNAHIDDGIATEDA